MVPQSCSKTFAMLTPQYNRTLPQYRSSLVGNYHSNTVLWDENDSATIQ